MVNTRGFTLSAVSDVESGDSEVLQERRIIGSGTECTDMKILSFSCVTPVFCVSFKNCERPRTFINRNALFRIDNVACDFAGEVFECMRTGNANKAAGIAVGVDV